MSSFASNSCARFNDEGGFAIVVPFVPGLALVLQALALAFADARAA